MTEEQRRQYAFDVAWKALARRDRTQLELRRILAGKRVDPALIDEVSAELEAGGYLDDAGYARRFAEDRRNLDGWGAERIERRLRALGVASEHVAAALHERSGDQELEAAVALLERRFPSPPQTARDRDRVLAALLRKGYELELAHDAVRRYAGAVAAE